MAKIYLVTTGEYSEYRVDGVFSTYGKALDFQRYHACDRIEEKELDKETPAIDKFLFYAVYNLDEKSSYVHRVSNNSEALGLEYGGPLTCSGKYPGPHTLDCHIWAWTEEAANKILTDKLRAFLAGQTVAKGYGNAEYSPMPHEVKDKRNIRFTYDVEIMYQNGQCVIVHDNKKEKLQEALC